MTKNFFKIIFFLLYFSNLQAEIIKKIVVNGNNRVSPETIKVYGEIEINKDYSESDLDIILKNLYATEFFETVNISLNGNILQIGVKEYPVINQLIIIGEKKKSYEEQLRKLIKLTESKSFIKVYLLKDVDIIKQLYSSLGYNFAEVETKIRVIDDKSVDLLIEINRGERTKVSSINFIGNNNVRSKRLSEIIASEVSRFWKVLSKNTNLSENIIKLDKSLLLNYYKSLGYYNVKVNSNIAKINNSGNADLVYTIEEGNRFTINKISTNVDKVFDKDIFFPLNEVYKNYAGDYYSPFKIKKLLDEIDNLIENNNLQFVEHNVQETLENDSINVVFNIFEGDKNLVQRINITGNNTTNEEVIRGELLLDEGDPLTKLNLDKSISRIKSRAIFKDVIYKISDGEKNNLKIIDINVEEQSTGEISAGAGIGTSGGSLAFGIKENNWLGEGKSIALDVEINPESLAGYLNYSDPNYDFLGNSLYYSLGSSKNDKPNQGYENSVISASVGTSFEQYKNVRVNLGLNASYDELKTLASASKSLKKNEGTFNELSASYGFSYDLRDRSFMPTSGSFTSFNQSLPIYADKKFIANTFTRSLYKAFNEDFIGSAKFFASSINGIGEADVRLSKRRNLSQSRLRGFESGKIGPVDGNDHIGGNYATALNFETSLPNLIPENYKADANIFLDFGNVWGVDYADEIDNSSKLRSSTGINVNWVSPIGPISFIFAQNIAKANTDVTQSFNFNLGTTF
jgi:outer membrane protein insertion porin family